jgi:hypothetical protein
LSSNCAVVEGTGSAMARVAEARLSAPYPEPVTVQYATGTSGSITVTHDGSYGALAGKAVALEPATGSSFDSPLAYRPR